ncbi:MAG TPA: DUF885 family protein, partial [Kofleriaceae bacterium]
MACSHPQQAATPTPPEAVAPAPAPAPPPAPPAPATSWIERSNKNTEVVLASIAKMQPEGAARLGIPGLDEQISDFTPGHHEREREAKLGVLAELEKRLPAERDPLVARDLQILIDAVKRDIEGRDLHHKLEVEYRSLPEMMFGSMRALLDPQIAAERHPAALVRLKKYLGLEGNQASVVKLAIDEARDELKRGLLPPAKLEVTNDLETSQHLIDGVDKLFAEYKLAGAEPVLAEFHKQMAAWLTFVRAEILPKARTDFRLPPELYAFELKNFGVDIAPDELARRAHQGFTEIQGEMQKVAQQVAKDHGWKTTDYRDVIKQLKKSQIADDQVLEFYKKRLGEIEGLIQQHHLVTLPTRPARIRLGSPAENAQQPAPHM